MSTWTQTQTLKLIELYEKYPSLYQYHHAEHKNRAFKLNCMNDIVQELKSIRPGTKIGDVTQKIRTLKTQFCKEKNRLFTSRRAGEKEVYVPKLWCYNKLYFWENSARQIFDISILPDNYEEDEETPDTKLDLFEAEAEECDSLPSTSSTPCQISKSTTKPLELEVKEAPAAAISNDTVPKTTSNLRPFLENLQDEMLVVTNEALMRDMRWKILDVVRECQQRQTEKDERERSGKRKKRVSIEATKPKHQRTRPSFSSEYDDDDDKASNCKDEVFGQNVLPFK